MMTILDRLKKGMEEASEDLEFEKAIEYRELIASVQKVAQKQKITDTAARRQGYPGHGGRGRGRGGTGFLYPRRKADRKGSFSI